VIETLLDITRSIQADNLRRENQDRTSRISLRAQQTATINRTLADSRMLELQLRIGTLATYYSEDEFTHVLDSIMNGLNVAERNVIMKNQIMAWFKDANIILASIAEENARTVAGTYVGIGALSGLTGLRIPVVNGSSQIIQRLAQVGLRQGPLTSPSLVYKALAFGQQILTSIGNAATFPARLIARAFAYAPNTCVFVGGAGAIWHVALTEDDRTVLRDIASRAGNTVMEGANAVYGINSEFRDYLIERGLNVTDEDMADLISRASSSRGSVTDDTIAASISGNTEASQSIAASIASASSRNSKASRIVTDLQAAAAAGNLDRFIDILQRSESELGQQGAIDTNLDAEAHEVESMVQGEGSLVGREVDASNATGDTQMSELSQSQSWSRTGSPAYRVLSTNSQNDSGAESQEEEEGDKMPEEGDEMPEEGDEMPVGMSSRAKAEQSGMAAPEEMANLLTGDDMNEGNKGGRRKSRRRLGKLQTKKRQYRLRRRQTHKKKHMRRRTLKRRRPVRRPLRQAKRRSLKKQRRLRRRQTRR